MKKVLFLFVALFLGTSITQINAQTVSKPGITAKQYISKLNQVVQLDYNNPKLKSVRDKNKLTMDEVFVSRSPYPNSKSELLMMIDKKGGGILYIGFSPTIPKDLSGLVITEGRHEKCLAGATRGGDTEWNFYDNCMKDMR